MLSQHELKGFSCSFIYLLFCKIHDVVLSLSKLYFLKNKNRKKKKKKYSLNKNAIFFPMVRHYFFPNVCELPKISCQEHDAY